MEIIKTNNGDKTVFALVGRLDTITAPKLQEEIIPEFENVNKIMLDFADVAYVSSAGLRVLLMGEKKAKSKDGSFILKNVSDEIMEVFEMTGFSDILTVE